MFELKITGLVEARLYAQNKWSTHIISLVGPDDILGFTAPNHCIQRMHDVASQLEPQWILPNEAHLEKVLDFTKDLKEGDKLLVHCYQGISRSTSIAIAVMIQHGMDYESAYRYIESIRNILLPNFLFTKFTDERFGLNGDLIRLVADERNTKLQAKFGDQFDDKHESLVAMKSILEKLNDLK